MFRTFVCAMLALALFTFTVLAKEYKGQCTAIDTDGKTLTVKVGDKEEKIKFDDKTSFTNAKSGKAIEADMLSKMSKQLNKQPREVTVETNDTTGVATKVSIAGGKK